MARNINNISIENAKIIFKNFSGRPDRLNVQGGKRSFGVIIDDGTAENLINAGWTVRYLKPREEGDAPTPYLTVKIAYSEKSHPNIFKVINKRAIPLNIETVGSLDFDEIVSADIILRPYEWESATGSGVSAYLTTAYVKVDVDEFAHKYEFNNVDDSLPFN